MLQESMDLLAEVEEFHLFLQTLDEDDWERPTGFMNWTPWDVVAHLHYFDLVSQTALEGEEPFKVRRDALIRSIGKGMTNAEIAREEFGDISPANLLDRWMTTCRAMAAGLGESNPKRRLPWFGPDMGVRMFTTARYMETWAHSQEVYDLRGVKRVYNDRIKNVAAIGVRTFGWTFVNRKLEVPGAAPYLRLIAPSGEIWEWNDPSEAECVKGDAAEFCHVVTQGRNVEDTNLKVVGKVANEWMAIAQCFAGGPVDPPKPGERK
ncbi:MAG TPA: TIGR03084 family protein [Myxococcales bacterium]|nr:TIGR03084 family protein [Myxococcales bacterium]